MRGRVVLLALLLLVAGSCGDSVFSSTTTAGASTSTVGATTTAPVTTTVAPLTTVVAGDTGLVWSRVPDDGAVFGGAGHQAMFAVVAGGPGLVAVGFDASGGEQDAAVWVSADGLVWSRARHRERVFGGPGDQMMDAVAVGGPGLVAVGVDAPGGDGDAAVWVSADGLVWSRVRHREGVFGGPGHQSMLGVAAGGPGWVAVGSDGSGGDGDAGVWIALPEG